MMLLCENMTFEKVGVLRLNSLATFLSSAVLLPGSPPSSCLHRINAFPQKARGTGIG